MRLEIVPQLLLLELGQPAREPPPHHPKLAPVRLLGVKFYTVAKQEKGLLATPLVQRITEPRAQAVAGELEKHPLVIGGPAAAVGARVKLAPQFAQQRQPPPFTR